MPELSTRRERFCREIVKGRKPRLAATNAGYSDKGDGARRTAGRLLTVATVKARIEELYESHLLSTEQIAQFVTDMAAGTWAQYLVEDDAGLPSLDWKRILADGKYHLLQGFEVTDKGAIKWKVPNGQSMLESLAKTSGVLKEKVQELRVNGKLDLVLDLIMEGLPDVA